MRLLRHTKHKLSCNRRLNYLCCPQAIPAESLSAAVAKKHIFTLDAAFATGTNGVVYAVSAQEHLAYLQWGTVSRYYFELMVMLLHAYRPLKTANAIQVDFLRKSIFRVVHKRIWVMRFPAIIYSPRCIPTLQLLSAESRAFRQRRTFLRKPRSAQSAHHAFPVQRCCRL